MRLLEWRYLGAPATGSKAGKGGKWWLTERDRHANNLGATFAAERQADLGFDVALDLPAPAAPCTFGAKGGASPGDPFDDTSEALDDLQDKRFKPASEKPWSQAS
jgi:hypothetical protein